MNVLLLIFAVALASASAHAAPITTAAAQKELIDILSTTLNNRYSDTFEIHTVAKFLKSKYEQAGISSQVLEYDPMDAYPYYFQNTNDTYRSYFQHMIPMFRADFDELCDETLLPEQNEKVVQRLMRVGLEKKTFCKVPANDRVEKYISTTVAHTAAITKKQLEARTETLWPNVMALIPTAREGAEVNSRPLCVLGAHMDSVAREGGGRGPIVSPLIFAPGADDNASGTAAVFTLARALKTWIKNSPKKVDCDLAFVHFSGEEEGLLGSLAFVHTQTNRPIKWMVNFDMTAYNANHDSLWNIGYDKRFGKTLANYFDDQSAKLSTVIVERDTFIYSSDQISFWGIGVPAISVSEQACATEKCEEPFKHFNPYLHTAQDSADKLDFEYAAQVIEQSFVGITKAIGR